MLKQRPVQAINKGWKEPILVLHDSLTVPILDGLDRKLVTNIWGQHRPSTLKSPEVIYCTPMWALRLLSLWRLPFCSLHTPTASCFKGLCTCCSLHLECSPHRYPVVSLPVVCSEIAPWATQSKSSTAGFRFSLSRDSIAFPSQHLSLEGNILVIYMLTCLLFIPLECKLQKCMHGHCLSCLLLQLAYLSSEHGHTPPEEISYSLPSYSSSAFLLFPLIFLISPSHFDTHPLR